MTAAHRRRRTGFTLVEVMVALTLSAIVLLGAREVIDTLARRSTTSDRADREHAMRVNGERLLRELVLDSRAGTEPRATFGGVTSALVWDTWCRTPQGWKERCRIDLAVRSSTDGLGFALVATGPDAIEIEVVRDERPPRLVFLEDARHGGRWSATWGPATVRPVAVGVITARDTLILPTGRALR